MTLLRELSSQAKVLCPGAIQHKDFADMMIHIESFIKQEGGASGASMIETLEDFLNSDPYAPAPDRTVN